MLKTGNYLSPTYFGEDRFQKPILFYWLILAAYGARKKNFPPRGLGFTCSGCNFGFFAKGL